MTESLDQILRRVASGELSVDDAEPLIAAAAGDRTPDAAHRPEPRGSRFGWPRPPAPPVPPDAPPSPPSPPAPPTSAEAPVAPGTGARRIVRLQVMEGGRSVVNLRIPMSLAGLAGSVLPGLSNEHADRLRDAIRSGTVGRILEVQDEDGDGVIISTE
jgi:hypothetical protein